MLLFYKININVIKETKYTVKLMLSKSKALNHDEIYWVLKNLTDFLFKKKFKMTFASTPYLLEVLLSVNTAAPVSLDNRMVF